MLTWPKIRRVPPALLLCGWLLPVLLPALGCATPPAASSAAEDSPAPAEPAKRELYHLVAERTWQLDSPGNGRFDASGLLMTPEGELLTVSDRNSDLYRIEFTNGASARIVETGLFHPEKLRAIAPTRFGRYDTEGIAQDERGRIYICEEAERSIFRWDPATDQIEKLEIDWAPVRDFFRGGINASFEGIAVGENRLYVANERSRPVLIVIDLDTLTIVDHFTPTPSGFALGGPHYSDLSWFEGHLYLLDRNYRAILKIEPSTRRILAQYNYAAMELAPEVAYHTDYPTGTMEGLAVTATHFWLVTDNNGRGRKNYPNDPRPTLFRAARPDTIE